MKRGNLKMIALFQARTANAANAGGPAVSLAGK